MPVALPEWLENPKAKVGMAIAVALVLGFIAYSLFWSGGRVQVSSLPASGSTKASISGVVTDFQGKPVPNLALKVSWTHPELAGKKPFTATTDAQGKFKIADMVNGSFSITPADKTWVGGTVVMAEADQETTVTMKVRKK